MSQRSVNLTLLVIAVVVVLVVVGSALALADNPTSAQGQDTRSSVPMPTTLGQTTTIPVAAPSAEALALTADGSTLVVGSYDEGSPTKAVGPSTITVLDAHSGTIRASAPTDRGVLEVAVTPDGRYAYATASVDDIVDVIDLASAATVARISVGDFPEGVAVSPDGRTVYTAQYGDGTVTAIDTATNSVAASEFVGPHTAELAATRDGRSLLAAYEGGIDSLDATTLQTQTTIATLSSDALVTRIVASPDGTQLIAGTLHTADDGVLTISPATGESSLTSTGAYSPFALAETSSAIYLGESDDSSGPSQIAVLDRDGSTRSTFPLDAGRPEALAVDPTGATLYTATGATTISVTKLR